MRQYPMLVFLLSCLNYLAQPSVNITCSLSALRENNIKQPLYPVLIQLHSTQCNELGNQIGKKKIRVTETDSVFAYVLCLINFSYSDWVHFHREKYNPPQMVIHVQSQLRLPEMAFSNYSLAVSGRFHPHQTSCLLSPSVTLFIMFNPLPSLWSLQRCSGGYLTVGHG